MIIFLQVVETVFTAYFIYVAGYNFVLSVAGLFYRGRNAAKAEYISTLAVFIPAYKEDNVIVGVAKKALMQDYPAGRFRVVVIADSLRDDTLAKLRALPIDVVEVSFDQSTKVKALNVALEQLKGRFDNVVILDADNIMERGFLRTINDIHGQRVPAIQGRRASKNHTTDLALLDGLSEEINNHINGKGSTALGLSASLRGSGMSFNYELLRTKLAGMNSIGGFDRELEVRLLADGVRVVYAPEAVVFDEKVEKKQVFKNQRKRWIASQYQYLAKYFLSGCKGLIEGRFAFFNSSVLRNVQLPRLLNLGILTGAVAGAFLFEMHIRYVWLVLWLLMIAATGLAIPADYRNKKLFRLILSTPGLFITMFSLLFKLKGANKKFIHTPHGQQG